MRPDGGAFVLTPGGVLVPRTLFSTAAAPPWNAIRTGPGVLKSVNITLLGGLSGIVSFYDSLTATGTPILQWNPGNDTTNGPAASRLFNLPFTTGLSMDYSQGITALNVATVSTDDEVRHLFHSKTASPWTVFAGKGKLKGIGFHNGAIGVATVNVFDNTAVALPQIAGMSIPSTFNLFNDFDLPCAVGLTISANQAPVDLWVTYTLG